MLRCYQILPFIFFQFSISFCQAQIAPRCEEFKKECQNRKKSLKNTIAKLKNPTLLSKDDLLRVIYAEYMTYDPGKDKLERSCVVLFSTMGKERYKSISIGPFQMQLNFIRNILLNSEDKIINNPTLLGCKKSGYLYMIDHLAELTQIETQWAVLLLFEKFCINNKTISTASNIDPMINYYNSGKKTNNKITFSKITCDAKTYLEWSHAINKW